MDGFLKVTPEELQNASTQFANRDNSVYSLTTEMNTLINAMINTDVWAGEAAEAFKAQFHELNDDMEGMHRRIQEHSKDLNEMAEKYKAAETQAESISEGLGTTAGLDA